MIPRLKEQYLKEIQPDLKNQFGFKMFIWPLKLKKLF